MKEQRRALWTAATLVALGLVCAGARVKTRRGAPATRGDTFWRVTYDVNFVGTRPGARVRAALPNSTRQTRVYGEAFSHPGLWLDVVRGKHTGAREAVAVTLERGRRAELSADFDIHASASPLALTAMPKAPLPTQLRAHYLRSEGAIQSDDETVRSVASGLMRGKTTRELLVERIVDHCTAKIASDTAQGPSDAVGVLRANAGTPLGRTRAMIALCRACQIPARLVAGLRLENHSDARTHVWAEVRLGKRWVPYDVTNGYRRELPPTYLALRRDAAKVVRGSDVADLRTKFSIQRVTPLLGITGSQPARLLDIVDLTRLPIGMQETLAILLLLPAGALITSIFRNVVGIRTFGTFTPSLLALSFVYADWRVGTIVFALVMAIGLGCRALLDQVKLLMVPRLSVVLTLVVLCLTLAVSTFDHFGLTPSARAVILPLVILTMMIERFYINAEEDGLRNAAKVLTGTLAVALCCLMVLRGQSLGRLALTYPEAQVVVAAALILVGRYSGYRLTELWRFRDLAIPRQEEQ